MDVKISGKVVEILEELSGEGRNGPWRKRDFILETGGTYPKKICMTQWGDQIDAMTLNEGDSVTASVDIASREYNGRWYTDVKAWRIEPGEGGGSSASGQPSSAGTTSGPVTQDNPPSAENVDPFFSDDDDDVLPF